MPDRPIKKKTKQQTADTYDTTQMTNEKSTGGNSGLA